jgi:hypothetical protein
LCEGTRFRPERKRKNQNPRKLCKNLQQPLSPLTLLKKDGVLSYCPSILRISKRTGKTGQVFRKYISVALTSLRAKTWCEGLDKKIPVSGAGSPYLRFGEAMTAQADEP